VLRRIFGPKREEMAGRWRRLHGEELHNLYVVIKSMGGEFSTHGRDEKFVQNFGRNI